MRDRVLSALAQGATLLTANRRLRRTWRLDFDAAQQRNGLTAWPSPRILSYQDWLTEAHEDSFSPRLLLSDFAERYLWERIIARHDPHAVLLDQSATAAMAAQAWALLCAWRVPLDHPAFAETEDTAAFAEWAKAFAKECEQRNWLSPAALADAVDPVAAELWLTGFDEITPQQQALLARRDRPYFVADPPSRPIGHSALASYADPAAELRAAARWARLQVEQQGARTVGVVVQDLAARRPLVEAIFTETLGGPLINISLGRPLADYPLIDAALRLLRFAQAPLPLADIGQLLLSPFLLGGVSEYNARARLDAELRRKKVLRLTAAELALAAQANCPRLAQSLADFAAPSKQHLPSAWAEEFLALLGNAGWPGERTLNSEERQTERRWQRVLGAFSELDPVTGRLGYSGALALLRRLLTEEIFQPETGVVPIQILEALQAAGAQFDALWVQGMDDRTWPAAARPNPFLPFRLQRDLGLPHSSAERELVYARKIITRLQQTSPQLIFSYAHREAESELRPSRLVTHLPPFTAELPSYPTWAEAIRAASIVETFTDAKGPAWPAVARVRSGTRALKAQAQCPFQAFALTQLRAEPLEAPEEGIDVRDRGTILHRALELFWRDCQSHAELVAGDWAPRLEQAIDEAVNELPAQSRNALLLLERHRLSVVLQEWLALEAAREPFTVVGFETTLEPDFNGLTFSTRADRIDQLRDGRTMIIDYKTGLVSKKSWDGERPDEPQLPLYAITTTPSPTAVAFAQVRRGDCDLVQAPVPLEDWRRVIGGLVEELRQGHAIVAPKDDGKPCQYCHLQTLCRIAEVTSA